MTTPLFLRISIRRLVQAACLALGVGFLAALFVYTQPSKYESTASIRGAQFFPPEAPDYVLRPFADDVVAAVTDPHVARTVAEDTAEPAADIEAELEAARVGDGGDVEVRYVSSDGDTAEDVVVSASHLALDRLARSELDRAQIALERAQQAQDTAAGDAAQRRVDEAREAIAAAASSGTVEQPATDRLAKLPHVLRGAITGTVIAGALVLMIFVALERGRPTIATLQRPAMVPGTARPVPSSGPPPPVTAAVRVQRHAPAPDDRWREDENEPPVNTLPAAVWDTNRVQKRHAGTDESSAAYDNGIPTRK